MEPFSSVRMSYPRGRISGTGGFIRSKIVERVIFQLQMWMLWPRVRGVCPHGLRTSCTRVVNLEWGTRSSRLCLQMAPVKRTVLATLSISSAIQRGKVRAMWLMSYPTRDETQSQQAVQSITGASSPNEGSTAVETSRFRSLRGSECVDLLTSDICVGVTLPTNQELTVRLLCSDLHCVLCFIE